MNIDGGLKALRKIIVVLAVLAVISLVVGCTPTPRATEAPGSFAEALRQARGKTVNFYGWGGSAAINRWMDEVVAPALLAEYGVTMRRVPMNIDEILNKLTTEKQAGKLRGDIDVIWINGENFYNAKKQALLYGPFTSRMDNFKRLVNPDAPDTNFDFGTPIEGMSAPWGRAQLVFAHDSARLAAPPKSAQELLALAKANPGLLSYPAPPDFVGSAFVRNIIYEIVGFEAINNAPAEREAIKNAIMPALNFLNELEPYLWQQGTTYPANQAALSQMFGQGQLLMSMSYTPFYVAQKIANNEFPATARTFVFDKGNIGNTHYLAIPFNSPEKAAALVLIHHLQSVAMQASKLNTRNWGDLPVLDLARMTAEERATMEAVPMGTGVLPIADLLSRRMPEVHASKVAIIEELWREYVLNR